MEWFNFIEIAKAHPRLFFLALYLAILVFVGVYWHKDKADTQRGRAQDDAHLPEGNTSMLFRYPAAITGKALFLQMNEDYFDAIFSGFLRSLQHAGFTLSDREVGPPSLYLLTEVTLDRLARDVERARQEYMTLPGTDVEADIGYQMQSGRARMFLFQLIGSCETLGWKVAPLIRQPEDECANSFSVLP
ncbi:hypothetical protein C2125_13755 [Rahnella aquatilis]|jgi:hypothetical protein|nr:hypothetical protein [Rahnella aquatilis]RBQ33719.1 hypothetical protein C2125_13755 [Rahnella aquatilis]